MCVTNPQFNPSYDNKKYMPVWKESQMLPVHVANLVANSGKTSCGVDGISHNPLNIFKLQRC